MDERESFKLESLYGIMTWHFPIRFFLSVALSISKCMSALGPSLSLCKSVFYLIYPFGFFITFFLFPYFALKFFWFFCIQWLVYPRAFYPYLLVEFSFVIWECNVLFFIAWPCLVIFKNLLSFTNFFWFIFPVAWSDLWFHFSLLIPSNPSLFCLY